MINVSVFRLHGEITGFEISGHAESGPYGHDLVCAAVSAVSIGAVNAIVSLCEFEPEISQDGEGGYLKVTLPDNLDEAAHTKAQTLLEGMQVSLETIENEYSQYIKITQM
ncbi:ribosomal-processing cysteine protease Prp [Halobacillus shinanisalinarum]|uniref:Ribosomal processing cysteine protease Prp n=1 Tax=Halobacillus shinanisalinarum TaxID=2932258 RepID=A0ABY4H0H7_9BACI|nr:ribosomal-processing cysteine protease Prp [Halobacillus shinanisalinarum]UOQ93863.1 ribosomal-processing cysteine protease Prp [Halobacillus shinanisalinarum]